jgi:hypothetical protein
VTPALVANTEMKSSLDDINKKEVTTSLINYLKTKGILNVAFRPQEVLK